IQEEEKGLAVSTVNKRIAVLRSMLNKAVHLGLLEDSPLDKKPSLMKKENNEVIRWLEQKEYHELLSNCEPTLHSIVTIGANSGLRREELLSLKWDQIKEGVIYLPETKSNELQSIPINKVVAKTLDRLMRSNPEGSEFVFCKKNGERYKDIKTSFTNALKKSKIVNFRFHDLRHTFASWLVLRGVSLAIVQKLLRHKDYKTTLRYAHLADKTKEEAVNAINELSNDAPPPKKPENPINRIARMRKLRKGVAKTT
ncbi:MAG: site-specific integrase, partial [Chlorobiales bacterium]|nr:site-specific integrase [Chlorobiales bacterium]